MTTPPQRNQVFFSYSHKNRKWLERFQAALKPLTRDNQLSVWDDTRIEAGDIWRAEIEQALASAKVAVLLVSIDFLESDFIYKNELPPLLDAAQNEGLKILLVVVGPSLFDETDLGRYQAANDPARPLESFTRANRDREIVRICREIKAAMTSAGSVRTAEAVLQEAREAPAEKVPQFLAEFVRDSNGGLRRSGKKYVHYEIRLFVKDAPRDTQKVIYELHETYDEPTREAPKGRRDFEEYITSYGDYIVNVTINGGRITEMNDWLTSALQNYYGDNASDEILSAIKQLEEH